MMLGTWEYNNIRTFVIFCLHMRLALPNNMTVRDFIVPRTPVGDGGGIPCVGHRLLSI